MAGSVPDRLALLAEVFRSDRKAAAFLGVSHTQFPAWRAGATPAARSLTRITDGVAVIERLRAHGFSSDEILTELHSVWQELKDRPAAFVGKGESQPVMDAIDARYGEPSAAPKIETPADLVAALRALAVAAAASADALAQGAR